MKSACRQNNIDLNTFEPKWWGYSQQSIHNRVETVPDKDESGTAEAGDAIPKVEHDENAAYESSEHEYENDHRQSHGRNDDQAPQQGQEDGDEGFTDALEDQPSSSTPQLANLDAHPALQDLQTNRMSGDLPRSLTLLASMECAGEGGWRL